MWHSRPSAVSAAIEESPFEESPQETAGLRPVGTDAVQRLAIRTFAACEASPRTAAVKKREKHYTG